jgi:hypothetical protein
MPEGVEHRLFRNTVQIIIQAEDKSFPELRKIRQNLDALSKIKSFKEDRLRRRKSHGKES